MTGQLQYGLLLNTEIYYLSKSLGLNDCSQLDNHPALLDEICGIITIFETTYEKYPSLEFVNEGIVKELAVIRNSLFKAGQKPGIVRKRSI